MKMKATVDFNDMMQTFRMMKYTGRMKNLLKMIPGFGTVIPEEAFDQANGKRIEAIVLSMTPMERSTPNLINWLWRSRIAASSGTSIEEVNNLVQRLFESRGH